MEHRNYYCRYTSDIERDKNSTSSSNESDNYQWAEISNEIHCNRTPAMDIDVDKTKIRERKEQLRLPLNRQPEYLFRSEEYLPITSSVRYKKNVDKVHLFQRNDLDSSSSRERAKKCQKTPDNSPKDTKTIMTKFKSAHTSTCTTPTTETDSDDVEIRKAKRLNFGRVVSQSIRGSFRLVRRIRPKSDSDVSDKDKQSKPEQFRRFREFTALLVNTQQFSLQPPAPLVVEDPPSTDEELNDIRNQNPALLNGKMDW